MDNYSRSLTIGGDVPVLVSKLVTTMLRHYDQEVRQHDASRHMDSMKPVLMKAFAQKGARDFDDGYWLRLLKKNGSTEKRLEYCSR